MTEQAVEQQAVEQQAVEQQAEEASARVLALLAMYQAGTLAKPDAVSAMALAVYAGKIVASRWADIFVSTLANAPALGIAPGQQHLERLEEAVSTVLDEAEEQDEEHDEDEPEEPIEHASERLERLAVSETLHSHQKALRAAVAGQCYSHFREKVAPDACEICAPFRDRLHFATEKWEPHHPRCRCTLVPEGEPDSRQETESRSFVTIRRIA